MLQNNCLVEKGLAIKSNWASYEISLKRKGLIGKGKRNIKYKTFNSTKVFIIQNPFHGIIS